MLLSTDPQPTCNFTLNQRMGPRSDLQFSVHFMTQESRLQVEVEKERMAMKSYFTLLFPQLGQGPPYNSFCRCINAIPIFSAPHHLRLHLKPRAASRLTVCMKGSSRLSLSTSFPESLKLNFGLILLDVWLSSLKFPRSDSNQFELDTLTQAPSINHFLT